LKPRLNKRRIFWVERLFRSNLLPAPRPALSKAFRQELMGEFLPDIVLLEKLLDRDLSVWREPPSIESTGRSAYMAHGAGNSSKSGQNWR
jgi:hypothetical protein